MRLGIFIDEWGDGGVPVFLDRLEQFLTAQGHEVFLFLAHPYGKRDPMSRALYLPIKARLGARCVSLDMNSYPVSWRPAHFRQVLLAHGLSCLLLNHFNHYIELLAEIADKIPLISVAHTDSDFYYLEFLRSMEFTRAHISVSRRIQAKTLELTPPQHASRARYITYGIEDHPARFCPRVEGPLRVIYCARLDPTQKRCQDLVPVWRKYRNLGGTGELTIIGTGKNEEYLRKAFEAEIAGKKIRMAGRISGEETLDEMARGDVVLNLSNFEGLPQAVIESTSLGLYPLLSQIESGHGEIVETLGVGTLCHVGDTAAFGDELWNLEKNLAGIRGLREQIRQATLHHYPFGRAGLSYLGVMKEVGLPSPVPIQSEEPVRTLRERCKRLCLRAKYRRHFH